MIKRLYLIDGNLLAPVSATTDDIAVDADTGAKLLAGLSLGDYCYLTLVDGSNLEVVKVTRDYTGFDVARGQAGTQKKTFPIGTRVLYALTSAEIQDACIFSPATLYRDGYGVAEVENVGGAWHISIATLKFTTPGGIAAQVTNENEVALTDNIGAFGCCDGSVTGAPNIGGPYFYLTTSPYAHRVVENITGQPDVDGIGSPISPVGFGWLLTQPSTGETITSDISVLDGVLFGGSIGVTSVTEGITSDGTVLAGALFGGSTTYTTESDGLHCDGWVLIGQLFGNAVEYDRGLDILTSDAYILSGTLT